MKLHNYLKKELEAFGIGVVTTRTNQNTDRALYERGAASKGCNLFISVHSNAVGNGVNESVDYPVAYVLLNGSSTDIGLKAGKGCGISDGNCPEWKNRNTSGDKRRILWCASWCECSRGHRVLFWSIHSIQTPEQQNGFPVTVICRNLPKRKQNVWLPIME